MVNTHSYVRGSSLTNISDIWSYRLYGQFFTGPNVDHISDIYCIKSVYYCFVHLILSYFQKLRHIITFFLHHYTKKWERERERERAACTLSRLWPSSSPLSVSQLHCCCCGPGRRSPFIPLSPPSLSLSLSPLLLSSMPTSWRTDMPFSGFHMGRISAILLRCTMNGSRVGI